MNLKRSLQLAFVTAIVPLTLFASSHREAPMIREDPTVDNTDVYVFRSPDAADTVTIVANYNPFNNPAGGPNFHAFSDSALYEIHIDNNGDAVEDITYQFDFNTQYRNPNTFLYNTGQVTSLDDADLNIRQFYTVTRVEGDRRSTSRTTVGADLQAAPANVGPRSTPDYETNLGAAAVRELAGGGRVFAGPRDDPFFVDLGSIFDLGALRPIQSLHLINTPGNTAGVDALKGYNVQTIALQVPISAVTRAGDSIVGVWATASRPRVRLLAAGLRPEQNISGFTQVSRLGMPLVNEVVLPLALKDVFNTLEPSGDFPLFQSNELFRNRVLNPELASLIPVLYPGVTVPPAPRNDLVTVFLTGIDGVNKPAGVVPADMIRVNLSTPLTATPNPIGVIAGDAGGFPNGRRLEDDVIDIALRVVAGGYVLTPDFNKAPNNALTDGVNANDVPFLNRFPYVAVPHVGYEAAGVKEIGD